MSGRGRLFGFVLGAFIGQAAAWSLLEGVRAQTSADRQPALTAPLPLTPAAPPAVAAETPPAPSIVLSPPIAVSIPPETTPAPAGESYTSPAPNRSTPLPLPTRPAESNAQSPALRLEDLSSPTIPDSRVYFHYSTLEEGGEETARQYAHYVLDNGFLSIEIRPVNVAIKTASVRYFYEDDRAESVKLGQALQQLTISRGLPQVSYTVVDFLRFTPKPRKGTIEVWIPNDLRLQPSRTDFSAQPRTSPPGRAGR
jgi:hypothetical protein